MDDKEETGIWERMKGSSGVGLALSIVGCAGTLVTIIAWFGISPETVGRGAYGVLSAMWPFLVAVLAFTAGWQLKARRVAQEGIASERMAGLGDRQPGEKQAHEGENRSAKEETAAEFRGRLRGLGPSAMRMIDELYEKEMIGIAMGDERDYVASTQLIDMGFAMKVSDIIDPVAGKFAEIRLNPITRSAINSLPNIYAETYRYVTGDQPPSVANKFPE